MRDIVSEPLTRLDRSNSRAALWASRAVVLASSLVLVEAAAHAEDAISPPPLTFHAGSVELEPGRVELKSGVELGYGRYRLRSNDITVEQGPGFVSLAGRLHLAACPCPDPPVTLGASRVRVAEDGDVTLTFPRVEVEEVPVLALPWLWLRAPGKVGLLPPIAELRGDDGLLLGSGARLPLGLGAGVADVSAAGFVKGGVEIGARLETERTSTRLSLDELDGERAVVASHGAAPVVAPSTTSALSFAWDADAIRGDRAVAMTPDLFDATRPFDTLAAEIVPSSTLGPASGLLSAGVEARAVRGAAPLVAGPTASSAIGVSLGAIGDASARASGALLDAPAGLPKISLAQANLGLDLAPPAGPLNVRLTTRARGLFSGAIADDAGASAAIASGDEPGSKEGTLAGALTLGLPIVRRFESESAAPIVHLIEPLVEAGGEVGGRRGDYFAQAIGPVAKSGYDLAFGFGTSLGRAVGPSVRLDARAGAAAFEGAAPEALSFARLVAEARIVALSASAALLAPNLRGLLDASSALFARARVGPADDGPSLALELASQYGQGAEDARLLEEGLLGEPRYPFLDALGVSGAVEARAPITRHLTARARIDADLETPALLAEQGSLRYAHRCGCFALEIGGGHREARDGLDAFVRFDLTPPSR